MKEVEALDPEQKRRKQNRTFGVHILLYSWTLSSSSGSLPRSTAAYGCPNRQVGNIQSCSTAAAHHSNLFVFVFRPHHLSPHVYFYPLRPGCLMAHHQSPLPRVPTPIRRTPYLSVPFIRPLADRSIPGGPLHPPCFPQKSVPMAEISSCKTCTFFLRSRGPADWGRTKGR